MLRKIIICAPSYSDNNGGAIALHKLCSLINEQGGKAYLFPFVDNFEFNKFNYWRILFKFIKKHLREPFRRYKLNHSFKTSVLKRIPNNLGTDEWIVLYPEITFGNPLGAKNVIRWLLNNPGYDPNTGKNTKKIFFGQNELYFRIGPWFKDFQYPGSTTSKNFLQIFHIPLNLYNLDGVAEERVGSAYLLRKGISKKIVHDLNNSILIDGMKHHEIAKIFKRVEFFISYDSHSTFSFLAALCGCKSIVIPDAGVSEDEWIPEEDHRYGVAYGFENLYKAESTRPLLLDRYKGIEKSYADNVAQFLKEANDFFDTINQNA